MTGGTGFIGKSLIPTLLSKGHELLVLTRAEDGQTHKNLNAVVGDLNELSTFRDALRSFAPNCSVHLAWQGLPDYSFENCRNNLLAGLNLFKILRETGCNKVVAIGTCWEYGGLTGLVHEGDVGSSLNLFASFKLALKDIGLTYLNDSLSRFIWVRPFFVYGANQRPTSLVPTILNAFSSNQIPCIKNPAAVNDFVYVDDVASAIHVLIESEIARGVYNIGSGQPRAVWELVNCTSILLSKKYIYTKTDVDLNTAFWADLRNISDLGWKPRFSLEDGVRSILNCYQSKVR